jgi:hypothetical protein
LAVVASRSCLIGSLLRVAAPANRHELFNFLGGLSRDELECLAEFQGALVLEAEYSSIRNAYRLMADFFDPNTSERWHNPDHRAHKTFVVLAYLDLIEQAASSSAIPNLSNPPARSTAKNFKTAS